MAVVCKLACRSRPWVVRRSVPVATRVVPYQWRSRCAVPPGMPARSIALPMMSPTPRGRIGNPGRRELPGNHQPRRGIPFAASTSSGCSGDVAFSGGPQRARFGVDVFTAHLGDLVNPETCVGRQQNHRPGAPVHPDGKQIVELSVGDRPRYALGRFRPAQRCGVVCAAVFAPPPVERVDVAEVGSAAVLIDVVPAKESGNIKWPNGFQAGVGECFEPPKSPDSLRNSSVRAACGAHIELPLLEHTELAVSATGVEVRDQVQRGSHIATTVIAASTLSNTRPQ
jgi:hypothetical protein